MSGYSNTTLCRSLGFWTMVYPALNGGLHAYHKKGVDKPKSPLDDLDIWTVRRILQAPIGDLPAMLWRQYSDFWGWRGHGVGVM